MYNYDFFISYTKKDLKWAKWIAWILEESDYRVIIQDWDFIAGNNFVLQMDIAVKESSRIISILSPEYIESVYSRPEWAAAFANDPMGLDRKLIPIRVKKCELSGLLKSIIYIDLVNIDNKDEARKEILKNISGKRLKPLEEPPFPPKISIANADELKLKKIEMLKILVTNKAITVRERHNVKCVYEIFDGYYTNVTMNYERFLHSLECFEAILCYIKLFIKNSTQSVLSPNYLNYNESSESQFIYKLAESLSLKVQPLYETNQIAIIGTLSPTLYNSISNDIDFLDYILVFWGIDNLNLKSDKFKIINSVSDLSLLSDNERRTIVNAK